MCFRKQYGQACEAYDLWRARLERTRADRVLTSACAAVRRAAVPGVRVVRGGGARGHARGGRAVRRRRRALGGRRQQAHGGLSPTFFLVLYRHVVVIPLRLH